jgi:hypothetical protein
MSSLRWKLVACALLGFAIVSHHSVANAQPSCNDAIWGQASFSSANYSNRFIRHSGFLGYLSDPSRPFPDPSVELADATFDVFDGMRCRQGIKSVSLRSRNYPRRWMRHQNFRIKFDEYDQGGQPSDLFAHDASFEMVFGLSGRCISFRSVNYPDRYIRHRNFELWLDVLELTDLFKLDATFCQQPPRAGYYPTSGSPQPTPPPPPPPPIPQSQVKYCTDSCAPCSRDGLRCTLDNNCSFQNYRNPWACY